MTFSIHSFYSQIFKIWRKRRFSTFVKLIAPKRSDRMLDIGGYPWFWVSLPPVVGSIDALNLEGFPFDSTSAPEHNIRVLVGDGCNLEFPDLSYDIAFSNSVIEHVGSFEDQQRFASEMLRVAKTVWCQTPARECPIEPHYLAPFLHWFPRSVQLRLLRNFTLRGWLSRPSKEEVRAIVEGTRLITRDEMEQLFPGCKIYVEYLVPLVPKSYIAVRNPCWDPSCVGRLPD